MHFTLQTRYVRVIHIVCVLLYIIEREISEFEASWNPLSHANTSITANKHTVAFKAQKALNTTAAALKVCVVFGLRGVWWWTSEDGW